MAIGSDPWRATRSTASGFFPGQLWLAYQWNADEAQVARARTWTAGLESQKTNTTTHDIGFMLYSSFGNGLRLTGDDSYRPVLLTAAASLAQRYDPRIGATRSWNGPPGQFTVIVDNLMNLELLFWGARNGGSEHWRDIAVEHALTTLAHHVRPDGSTFHVARFDEQSGERVWRGTAQGYRDDTTWSRGQAWAVHGFTMVYRETGDERFLTAARRTADYFLGNLPPDGVPYWDFDVPVDEITPRDSSAAAIAASGLLDLALLEPDAERASRYRSEAVQILRSLAGPAYLSQGSASRSTLLHGTRSYPDGTSNSGLIYGDYYFLEALLRLRRQPSQQTALPVRQALASHYQEPNEPENVLDGSSATRWSAHGSGSWIRLDLGAARTVSEVSVAWHEGARRATRVQVDLSVDGSSWSTVFRGVSSGETANFENYDFPRRSARYVRIVGLGNTENRWTSITGVRVGGQ